MNTRQAIETLLLSAFIGASAMAQESWTLTKCIEYAKQQSLDVKRGTNAMNSATVKANTVRSSRLPDLNASVGQRFAFGRSIDASNAYINQNSANTSFEISASAPIFRGGYINSSIRQADLNIKASTEEINQLYDDITIKVTLAYLDVLFSKEMIKIAEENVSQSKQTLIKTTELVNAGRLPKSEEYESKAQLSKEEYNLTKAQGDLKLALLTLSQLMELSTIEGFDVEKPSEERMTINSNASLILSAENIDKAYAIRPAIKAAEYKMQAGEESIKIAKSAYYPTLNAVASYGNSYFNVFNMPNASFSTQVKNQGQKILGLQLNIPIFSRFENRNNVNLARIEQQQRSIDLSEAKKTLFKEMQQAYYNATTAQQSYLSASQALETSEAAYKYAQEKFSAGRSTTFELNEAKKRFTSSQSELAQAKYSYILRTKLLDYYSGTPITL